MANFKQHTLFSGSIGALVVAPFCIFMTELSLSESILACLWCWFAGMLPDLDADEGKPLTIIFDSLAIFGSMLAVASLGESSQLSIQTMSFLGAYYLIKYPVKSFVKKRTSHRGAFHSLPVGVILSALVCLAYSKEPELALALGCATLVGFISHLVLDEIYSIDLGGCRIKRSFGTALTLSTGSLFRNIILYSTMTALLTSSYLTLDFSTAPEVVDYNVETEILDDANTQLNISDIQ